MSPEERTALIDRLNRSFIEMPTQVKIATKHALNAPTINRNTGLAFETFKEVLETARDSSLETLKEYFEDNGDLLP